MGSRVHSEWSDELAKLPETLAASDEQVARWQSKYGGDSPTPRSNNI
jgi:hypothetical protein